MRVYTALIPVATILAMAAPIIRRSLVLVFLVGSLTATAASAAPPVPPCAGDPQPAFPETGAPAAVSAWFPEGDGGSWAPPACTGWTARPFALLVAVTGRFAGPVDTDALLRRIGALSDATAIRYWSASRRYWRTLLTESVALGGPDRDLRRADFTPAELRTGGDLYFWQRENNPIGGMVHRLRLRVVTADHLALEIENVTGTSVLFFQEIAAGEQETLIELRRAPDSSWTYYSLSRLGAGADGAVRSRANSAINRAVALYRHLAGIPTDRMPPAAP
jgi:hypothetical protein